MKNLNKLQNFIVPDIELCKRLLKEYYRFDDYYKWRVWAIPEMRGAITGYMPKTKAASHVDWIFFYYKKYEELQRKSG